MGNRTANRSWLVTYASSLLWVFLGYLHVQVFAAPLHLTLDLFRHVDHFVISAQRQKRPDLITLTQSVIPLSPELFLPSPRSSPENPPDSQNFHIRRKSTEDVEQNILFLHQKVIDFVTWKSRSMSGTSIWGETISHSHSSTFPINYNLYRSSHSRK